MIEWEISVGAETIEKVPKKIAAFNLQYLNIAILECLSQGYDEFYIRKANSFGYYDFKAVGTQTNIRKTLEDKNPELRYV